MTNYILSAFPESFDSPLPPFNDSGVLDPGDYAPTRAEFEARFVNYGDSDQRQTIYDGWNRHRDALMSAGLPNSSRQLLNGSYTTSKPSPGDIDIAVEVPVDNDSLPLVNADHPVVNLLQGPRMKAPYHCDAYPVFSLPPEHLLYERVTARAIRYWTKWFGHSRSDARKGRVWATTGGLP